MEKIESGNVKTEQGNIVCLNCKVFGIQIGGDIHTRRNGIVKNSSAWKVVSNEDFSILKEWGAKKRNTESKAKYFELIELIRDSKKIVDDNNYRVSLGF
jgi:hypothetical protein